MRSFAYLNAPQKDSLLLLRLLLLELFGASPLPLDGDSQVCAGLRWTGFDWV